MRGAASFGGEGWGRGTRIVRAGRGLETEGPATMGWRCPILPPSRSELKAELRRAGVNITHMLEKAELRNALLKSRAGLITEVGDLQRQNGELKALLNQYLSSRINEDLHVPPTQVIRLDGLKKSKV